MYKYTKQVIKIFVRGLFICQPVKTLATEAFE